MTAAEKIFLPYPVPYYAQIASPELAEDIFTRGMNPELDPLWRESGAETPQEYAYWVERACGVACLKMCVEAAGGPVRPLMIWARQGLARGGYLIRQDESGGGVVEIGWIHRALADMAREAGVAAQSLPAELEQIPEYVQQGKMVIASVSYQAGDDRLKITQQGGHLMVVIGFERAGGILQAFYVNNPSGRRKNLQAGARLARERFSAAYSGRVIVIG